MPPPHSNHLRRGRFSSPGQRYLVTFTTYRRLPHFRRWRDASNTARHLADPAHWGGARLLCWVLMPDHWHGLLELGEESLGRAVGRAKAAASRAWRATGRDQTPLWAQGFHDHALRREEDALAIARYIVANPVRAGIVKRVGDYPYWDAIWL